MRLKYQIITFIIYIVFVINHCISLNRYNKELVGLNEFQVMLHKDGTSWNYLLHSFILIIVGLILIYLYWRSRYYINSDIELIIILVLSLLIIISFIFIIMAISIPILQSAAVVVIAIGIGSTMVNA